MTGVQTCALPIWAPGDLRGFPWLRRREAAVRGAASRGSARGCGRRTAREEEEVVREEKVEVVRATGFVSAGQISDRLIVVA